MFSLSPTLSRMVRVWRILDWKAFRRVVAAKGNLMMIVQFSLYLNFSNERFQFLFRALSIRVLSGKCCHQD